MVQLEYSVSILCKNLVTADSCDAVCVYLLAVSTRYGIRDAVFYLDICNTLSLSVPLHASSCLWDQ